MACLQYLQKFGWNFSTEGYNLISKDDELRDADLIAKNACDVDIKEFGNPVLTKDLDTLAGPVVLQIQKLRNIAAPKSNETSGAAPRLLKLTLTDGHTTCQALELEPVSKLDIIKTAPGSKILFKKIQIFGSYLLITNSNATLLGGNVPALVERWQLSKLSITKHVRSGSDGPPPWVQFGQKVAQSVIADQNFKSLDTGKPKEQTKDEFDTQREEAIAEAAQGAVRKTFGGGNNKPLPPVRENQRFNRRQSTKGQSKLDKKKMTRERESPEVSKPSGKISLFAFLEDKLPAQEAKIEMGKPSYAEKYDASLRHRANDPKVEPKKTEKAPRFQRQNYPEELTNKLTDLSLGDNKSRSNVGYNKPHTNSRPQSGYNQRGGNKYSNNNDFGRKNTEINYSGNYDSGRKNNDNNFDARKNNEQIHFDGRKSNDQIHFNGRKNEPIHFDGRKNEQIHFDGRKSNEPFDSGRRNADQTNFNTGRRNNEHYESGHRNPDHGSYPSNNVKPKDYERHQNEIAVQKKVATPNQWQWNVGDRCMAKYWEDNQYYNASVTNVTPKTCVVKFNEYGNFEEVLKADCIPLAGTSGPPQANNRQYTGSLIFRRGGSNSQNDRSNNTRRN